MGKEIVYCVGCGDRLTEDDFERRRAHTVGNQPYCARCKAVPARPPEPPPTDETPRSAGRSTGTRRRNTTSRIPRVAPPTPGTRRDTRAATSRAIWIVAGCAGAVALVVLIIVLASGSKPVPRPLEPEEPPRKPRSAANDALEERVRDLERFAAASTDAAAILVRCDALRADVKGTPHEERLKSVEGRAVELRKHERDRELDRTIASIRKAMADDPAFEKRREIEGMLEAALQTAGSRAPEVQRLKDEYRVRCEAATRKPEPPKPPPRAWLECFQLALVRIQANDYPGAKPLYLEGLGTIPQTPPGDPTQLVHYVVGLYNIACIYGVEASTLQGAPRKEAADQAFKYLEWSLKSGYARFRCPCHAQTGGIGHMADDKDLDSLRLDPRYAELRKKYSN